MAEEELSQISVGEFETVSQLLASSEALQMAFLIMIVGIIGIVIGIVWYRSINDQSIGKT